MSSLVIVLDKVVKEEVASKSLSLYESIKVIYGALTNGCTGMQKSEYFLEISYSDTEKERVVYKTTKKYMPSGEENLLEGTEDLRDEKIIMLAHKLSSKGYKLDESQLALFMNDKIHRFIAKK
ncbi:hypothetical protein ACS6JK_05275 [Enterobacter chuandaensis]|uniref:hypothetical protein n=1 Tax=Enterobacter TaxID=547 RepID=UPI00292F88C5|nr:hypothetical protein [Enterobacter sp. 296B2]